MIDETKKIGGGLLPQKKDGRDFRLGALMSVDIKEIPDTDFIVANPIKIKDQHESDMCAAFAATAVSEDQENIELSPEFLFAKAKELSGDPDSWGLDLRTVCKAIVKYGTIDRELVGYSLDNKDRDFLADYKNWPSVLDEKAEIFRKRSYFSAEYGFDTFDDIRAALWFNREKKCSVLTGAIWDSTWTHTPGGIIPKQKGNEMFGHAFKIFGQRKINGELYLVAQLSNGTAIGDNGIYYFPREVVNRELKFGRYCFLDLEAEQVKNNVWPLWRLILETIKKIFK